MIRHSLVRKIAHDMIGQLRKSLESQQEAILAYVAEELEKGRDDSEPIKITVSMTYESLVGVTAEEMEELLRK